MRHVPVLLQEIMEGLSVAQNNNDGSNITNIRPNFVFVDCNLGDGGHSEEVIRETRGNVTIIGIDLDQDALDRAKENLDSEVEKLYATNLLTNKPTIHYVKTNFRHLETVVKELTVESETSKAAPQRTIARHEPSGDSGESSAESTVNDSVDAILFDLGLSSYELEESGRGFSFKTDDPLSMTFGSKDDKEYKFTAEDIVNKWGAEHIEIIIRSYGEERFAGRIARHIIEAREAKQEATGHGIETAKELADIVRGAYPGFMRFGRMHPATKTFQALRIAVNDELESLQQALPAAVSLLKKGGRLAVISYHSLEDRIVKNFFKKMSEESVVKVLHKKPLTPKDSELDKNPRSRSAKLRIVEKI